MNLIVPALALIAIHHPGLAQDAVDPTPTRQEIYPAVIDGRVIVAGGVFSQVPRALPTMSKP